MGALFVSAKALIIHIIYIGIIGTIFHITLCASIIVIKFSESVNITTIITISPITTSYDINWAVVLNDPNNAYLELADQPANIIPNTPIPDINNIYNVLYPISSIIIPLLNGITPHDIIPHTNVTYGANKNNTLFPCETNIVSFITNFNPSATLL